MGGKVLIKFQTLTPYIYAGVVNLFYITWRFTLRWVTGWSSFGCYFQLQVRCLRRKRLSLFLSCPYNVEHEFQSEQSTEEWNIEHSHIGTSSAVQASLPPGFAAAQFLHCFIAPSCNYLPGWCSSGLSLSFPCVFQTTFAVV